MAVIIPGTSEANGKLNDVVFYRSRWGNVVRDNFTPFDPGSPRQTQNRTTYTDLTAMWRTLSRAEQQSWERQIPSGKVSSSYTEFLKSNMHLTTIGKSPIRTPASFYNISSIRKLTLDLPTDHMFKVGYTSWDGTITLADNQYMVIGSTVGYSPHARCVDPIYRVTSILPPFTVSPFDIYADYITAWAPYVPISNTRIFVYVQLVSELSGVATVPVYTSALVP